jgi:hypothetical protein
MGYCCAALAAVIALLLSVMIMLPKPRNSLMPPRCNDLMPIRPPYVSSEGSAMTKVYKPTGSDPGFTEGKRYDLVVYGATGFTGQYVARYLASKYDPSFRWAVAGRSADKLKKLLSEFNPSYGVGMIVADSNDPTSLQNLMSLTTALVTTVGPYTVAEKRKTPVPLAKLDFFPLIFRTSK